jgi:hypothetical protein
LIVSNMRRVVTASPFAQSVAASSVSGVNSTVAAFYFASAR